LCRQGHPLNTILLFDACGTRAPLFLPCVCLPPANLPVGTSMKRFFLSFPLNLLSLCARALSASQNPPHVTSVALPFPGETPKTPVPTDSSPPIGPPPLTNITFGPANVLRLTLEHCYPAHFTTPPTGRESRFFSIPHNQPRASPTGHTPLDKKLAGATCIMATDLLPSPKRFPPLLLAMKKPTPRLV